MLRTLIEKKHYQFKEEFATWQDAIRVSYQPLLDASIVEDIYVQAVVDCVETYGPYIIIAPNIAMPHSTQGAQGVRETAISFMKVKKPVSFDEQDREKDASLFFSLAAKNSEQHLHNMMELSELLMNEDIVKDLLKAENRKDLERIVRIYNL